MYTNCTSHLGSLGVKPLLALGLPLPQYLTKASEIKLTAIDLSAVGTDLSLGWIRERLNVAHVDHGLRKILEEGILAGRELVDDRRRGALRLG